MIKSELIASLSKKQPHILEKDIANSINLLLEYMSSTLGQGQRIEIRSFGSFSLHYRPPRNAHNPKTGEKVITKAKYSPHFKPGKGLRERVDESRSRVNICADDREENDEEISASTSF